MFHISYYISLSLVALSCGGFLIGSKKVIYQKFEEERKSTHQVGQGKPISRLDTNSYHPLFPVENQYFDLLLKKPYLPDYAQIYNENHMERNDGVAKISGKGHQLWQEKKSRNSHYMIRKKKKKHKLVSVSKGFFVPGGVQVFGRFKSLKSCMKTCIISSYCFAGDYNPWSGRCYLHSNVTACNDFKSHSKITHFKKVPCTVTSAPRSRIILGTQLFGGLLQSGIDHLTDCVKKCVNAGAGISPSPTDLAGPVFRGNSQICFGINYDFSTHKCYFLVNNFPRFSTTALAVFSLCPITGVSPIRVPIDLQPNPAVITILLCPESTAEEAADAAVTPQPTEAPSTPAPITSNPVTNFG